MPIRKVKKEDEAILRRLANEVLKPIYGNQSKAINEWLTGTGFKHAFVLTDNKKIIGLLSLKANPCKPYLKISTLLVTKGHRDKNVGRQLLEKAFIFAIDKEYNEVLVTVSETKEEVLGFFMCSGFHLIKKCPDKYTKGITEYILRRIL